MADVAWDSIFDQADRMEGATEDSLAQFQASVFAPITAPEIEAIQATMSNPFPESDPLFGSWTPLDPNAWEFPETPLPKSYLDLLRWSNGGHFRTGEREFGFFSSLDEGAGVRAMMLAYHVPQYMPRAVPFAWNGGGVFYMFDMRNPPLQGEYPIICCGAGALGFGQQLAFQIADSFPDACAGTSNVESIRDDQAGTNDLVYVELTLTTPLALKQLATLKKRLGLECSIAQLKKNCETLPFPVARVMLHAARAALSDEPELRDALVAYDCEAPEQSHSLMG